MGAHLRHLTHGRVLLLNLIVLQLLIRVALLAQQVLGRIKNFIGADIVVLSGREHARSRYVAHLRLAVIKAVLWPSTLPLLVGGQNEVGGEGQRLLVNLVVGLL